MLMKTSTSKGQWELWIDLTFTNGTVHYNYFIVGSPSTNYTLSISGFTGITPIDPFSSHTGEWWHNRCFHINLNYNHAGSHGFIYLEDHKWHALSFAEMKIHKVGCIA